MTTAPARPRHRPDGTHQASALTVARRSLLLGALAVGGIAVAGCSATDGSAPASGASTSRPETTTMPSTPTTERSSRVMLAYFSRAGENYHHGGRVDLTVGNTQVLAEAIAARIECDVYSIAAVEAYSDDYDATVRRNVEEQEADARPRIAGGLPNLDGYDVVLLASPIWNVRPPMIMKTLTEALDFTGRTVHPVVTYAVSGLGGAEREYIASCPGATMGRPLAVRGETVADAGSDVDTWLRAAGLL